MAGAAGALTTAGCGAGGCNGAVGRCAQHDAAALFAGFDPAGDLAFSDPGQHLCVRDGGLGPEVAIFRGQVPEVFRNCFHGFEGIVETFQSA
jgi:hypothetical protein